MHSCTCNVVHRANWCLAEAQNNKSTFHPNLLREGERPPRLVGRMNARAGYRHLSLPILGSQRLVKAANVQKLDQESEALGLRLDARDALNYQITS